MRVIEITMKKDYSMKRYARDVKVFEKEGSFLGSKKDEQGRIVIILNKDKCNQRLEEFYR